LKYVIFILSLVVLWSCRSHGFRDDSCMCPDGKHGHLDSTAEVSDAVLTFPIVVYTYDRSLIDNPRRVIDSLNQAFDGAQVRFVLDKVVEFDFPEINKLKWDIGLV